ncbi:pilus assembly protein [Pasteurella skyensis]|uniref:Pilus assembly protein n=1 Tax=Phocoenobacter skyensis TaxID=97481 RepID=A0AAJ6NDP8_9PAST|nr:TadE/TadG family type IV pilus assembly protein [Pasteurella skyensis]MDP8170831.1 pilus assembly protein [Pasteurella skyensis]MDP8174937.1 pilus assembly protein [Pasteurella skyensis]
MNITDKFILRSRNALLQFWKNEQGVYTVMMSVLSFVLLGFIALVVDGSGILLDKARFTQGMEQAGLLIVAENNIDRPTLEHAAVTRQAVSEEEIKKFDNDKLKAQQDKRNREMIATMVRSYYMPLVYDSENHQVNDEFEYYCNRVKNSRSIACKIGGNFDRPSWVYLGNEFDLTFSQTVKVDGADTVYVTKDRSEVPPTDLMLVADFSGSMGTEIPDSTPPIKKVEALREVVDEISQELLNPKQIGSIYRTSVYNRIGFTAFAFGGQRQGEISKCVLPYKFLPEAYRRKHIPMRGYRIDSESNQPDKSAIIDFKVVMSDVEVMQSRLDWRRVFWDTRGIKYQWISFPYMVDFPKIFTESVDYSNTINMVDSFNGGRLESDVIDFDKNSTCLGIPYGSSSPLLNVTQFWFKHKENLRLMGALSPIQPWGGTLASSGLLIGANLIMNTNPEPKALPENLGVNTQRTIVILSDGVDMAPGRGEFNVTVNLLKNGLCDKIREKVDSLQDDNYPLQKTKIAFIAFAYSDFQKKIPTTKVQAAAWRECVGEDNFYKASNKEELLSVFRQITHLNEEVGHSISDDQVEFGE